jgi:hypothetical protein
MRVHVVLATPQHQKVQEQASPHGSRYACVCVCVCVHSVTSSFLVSWVYLVCPSCVHRVSLSTVPLSCVFIYCTCIIIQFRFQLRYLPLPLPLSLSLPFLLPSPSGSPSPPPSPSLSTASLPFSLALIVQGASSPQSLNPKP